MASELQKMILYGMELQTLIIAVEQHIRVFLGFLCDVCLDVLYCNVKALCRNQVHFSY